MAKLYLKDKSTLNKLSEHLPGISDRSLGYLRFIEASKLIKLFVFSYFETWVIKGKSVEDINELYLNWDSLDP